MILRIGIRTHERPRGSRDHAPFACRRPLRSHLRGEAAGEFFCGRGTSRLRVPKLRSGRNVLGIAQPTARPRLSCFASSGASSASSIWTPGSRRSRRSSVMSAATRPILGCSSHSGCSPRCEAWAVRGNSNDSVRTIWLISGSAAASRSTITRSPTSGRGTAPGRDELLYADRRHAHARGLGHDGPGCPGRHAGPGRCRHEFVPQRWPSRGAAGRGEGRRLKETLKNLAATGCR